MNETTVEQAHLLKITFRFTGWAFESQDEIYVAVTSLALFFLVSR